MRSSPRIGRPSAGSRKRTQAGYVDILRRYSRMAGGFLEIGADIGLFAEACARAGRFDRLWLSEANRPCVGSWRDRLAGQNVTILDTMSPAAAVPSGAISTVVMIHVLDHVLKPRAMLRDLFKTLEPGGMLMIVTHNPRSWLARCSAVDGRLYAAASHSFLPGCHAQPHHHVWL